MNVNQANESRVTNPMTNKITSRCRECTGEDVTVKVTDVAGADLWFCAPCWEVLKEQNAAVLRKLADMADALDDGLSSCGNCGSRGMPDSEACIYCGDGEE